MLLTRPFTNAELAAHLDQSAFFLAEARKRLSGGPASGTRPEIYVASRASIPGRPAMWRDLRGSGVPIISSWIDEAGPGQTANMTHLWQRIQNEITLSCGLILYAEPSDLPLKGALVEVGMALAMGKTVVVIWPPSIQSLPDWLGSWAHHPNVVGFDSIRGAADWLVKNWNKPSDR